MFDGPEKDLVIAVLQRAVEDARGDLKGLGVKDRQKVQQSALGWIRRNTNRCFSFLWVCDALELDPEWIRRRIKDGI